MSLLQIKNLHVQIEDKKILNGLTLTIEKGQVAAIMGPNGSGKSTLAYVLAGKPGYEVTEGEVLLDGENVLEMSPDERAAKGVFLAFQYPVEVPGVATMTFLRTALNAQRKTRGEAELSTPEFMKLVRETSKHLGIDQEMLRRAVNVGFSGGEKKRNEILQMAILQPRLAVLDEAGIGLVEHCKPRLEDRHLQNFVAFFLAAGEADINRAAQHLLVDTEMFGRLAHQFHELRRGKLGLAAGLTLGVERGAQEGHSGDAGYFDRVLERQEQALGGALVRRHRQNALAVEQHIALGDLVVVLAGQHIGKGRLAGTVRAHDGGNLALLDRQRQAVEDFLVLDLDMQIFDLKQHWLTHASFQRDRDQLLRFHREFHRQLLQHVLDETVDNQGGRFLCRHAALAAIEQHVLGDFRG